jgi:hypothetical protein
VPSAPVALTPAALELLDSIPCFCGAAPGGQHSRTCNQKRYDAARERSEALRLRRLEFIRKMVWWGKGGVYTSTAGGASMTVGSIAAGETKRHAGAVRAVYLEEAARMDSLRRAADVAASHALFILHNPGSVEVTRGSRASPAPLSGAVGSGGGGPAGGSRGGAPKGSFGGTPSAGASPAASGGFSGGSVVIGGPDSTALDGTRRGGRGTPSAGGASAVGGGSGGSGDAFPALAGSRTGCGAASTVEIDLHGQHSEEAVALLRTVVLPQCFRDGVSCLRIITGVGHHSSSGGGRSGRGGGGGGGGGDAPMKHKVGQYLEGLMRANSLWDAAVASAAGPSAGSGGASSAAGAGRRVRRVERMPEGAGFTVAIG